MTPLPKDEMRRKYGLPADAFIVVHTGLAPYDMRYLAEAFVILAKRHPNSLLVMTVNRFPSFQAIMDRAGLAANVVYLGMLDRTRLTEAMACADVLALPYTNISVNRYRYPNKLGDYLAAGRPIVTNRTGDLGQLIEQERAGLLADDTPQSFAEQIEKVACDPALGEQLAQRGRQLAEEKLDWRFLAADLERFYHDILSGRPQPAGKQIANR
jgi:glycosyltransferase involved in cell wall biosynthesis